MATSIETSGDSHTGPTTQVPGSLAAYTGESFTDDDNKENADRRHQQQTTNGRANKNDNQSLEKTLPIVGQDTHTVQAGEPDPAEMAKKRAKQHKKWNRRIKLALCFMSHKRNKDSIADVASLFTEFYSDLNVPSSELAAGFVLLSKYQAAQQQWITKNPELNQVQQYLSNIPIKADTKFLDISTADDSHLINDLIYYMNYTLAIFGWPMHAIDDPCLFCCIYPYLRLAPCGSTSKSRRDKSKQEANSDEEKKNQEASKREKEGKKDKKEKVKDKEKDKDKDKDKEKKKKKKNKNEDFKKRNKDSNKSHEPEVGANNQQEVEDNLAGGTKATANRDEATTTEKSLLADESGQTSSSAEGGSGAGQAPQGTPTRGVPGKLDDDCDLPIILEDNCCSCNKASAERRLAEHNYEIIYISYRVDVNVIPFLVAADHSKRMIVVALRGSFSVSDWVTDLNGIVDKLPIDNCPNDWLCHRGMTKAAAYLKELLLNNHILDRAFNCRPDLDSDKYNLLICGHSLGAGAAAILGVLLRPLYPNLKCYLYAPPGGILSLPVVEYTREFATGIILGNDTVCRMGIAQFERLRYQTLLSLKSSQKSTTKILAKALCPSFCCGPNEFEYDPSQSLDILHGTEARSFDYNGQRIPFQKQKHILYVPGRLIHIVKNYSFKSKTRRLFNEPIYQAIWTDNQMYDRIMVDEGMMFDHFPNYLLHGMKMLFSKTLPGPQKTSISILSANNKVAPVEVGDGLSKSVHIKDRVIQADICDDNNNVSIRQQKQEQIQEQDMNNNNLSQELYPNLNTNRKPQNDTEPSVGQANHGHDQRQHHQHQKTLTTNSRATSAEDYKSLDENGYE